MNWQRLISFFCAMAVLSFSANGLAKSNDLSLKPTIPSSKVKITAPTPAPPVLVAPTKTKTPVSQPAVSTGTPKPVPPKVSVKQPKPSTPKVSVKTPRLSAPKSNTAPASLPSTVRSGLPQAHIPKDLGQTVHIRRDLGKTNSISGRMPAGHNTPVAGSGAIGGGAGYAKGLDQRTGVDSAMYDRSDLTRPILRTGSGAHRQGDEKEDVHTGKYIYKDAPKSVVKDIIKMDKAGKSEDEIAFQHMEYLDTTTTKNKDGKDVTTYKKPDIQETSSERTVDEGPSDSTPDIRHINPDRVKGIFAGSPGIRFAPGEEGGEGGDFNPGLLGEISSNQTQIHFVEGAVPESTNFEDLSKQIQDAIKKGGPGDHIIE
jgi:hypothetical protein